MPDFKEIENRAMLQILADRGEHNDPGEGSRPLTKIQTEQAAALGTIAALRAYGIEPRS